MHDPEIESAFARRAELVQANTPAHLDLSFGVLTIKYQGSTP